MKVITTNNYLQQNISLFWRWTIESGVGNRKDLNFPLSQHTADNKLYGSVEGMTFLDAMWKNHSSNTWSYSQIIWMNEFNWHGYLRYGEYFRSWVPIIYNFSLFWKSHLYSTCVCWFISAFLNLSQTITVYLGRKMEYFGHSMWSKEGDHNF